MCGSVGGSLNSPESISFLTTDFPASWLDTTRLKALVSRGLRTGTIRFWGGRGSGSAPRGRLVYSTAEMGS